MINTILMLYKTPLKSLFRVTEYAFRATEYVFHATECLFRDTE